MTWRLKLGVAGPQEGATASARAATPVTAAKVVSAASDAKNLSKRADADRALNTVVPCAETSRSECNRVCIVANSFENRFHPNLNHFNVGVLRPIATRDFQCDGR